MAVVVNWLDTVLAAHSDSASTRQREIPARLAVVSSEPPVFAILYKIRINAGSLLNAGGGGYLSNVQINARGVY